MERVESRSEEIRGRVTPREKAMIEKYCKQREETVSDYVRSSVLTSMVMEGSGEAIGVLAKAARKAVEMKLEEWKALVAKAA